MSLPKTSGSTPLYYPRSIDLKPILPSYNDRYTRRVECEAFGKAQATPETPAAPSILSRLPGGWKMFVHPEGACYFYHHEMLVVTTSDPRNPHSEERLEAARKRVIELSTGKDVTGAEVFLKLSHRAGEVEYYLINTDRRTVFWVEDVDPSQFGLFIPSGDDAFSSFLGAEYWVHKEYFSPTQTVDEGAEAELLSILKYGELDDLTSPTSTSPYSADDCRRFAAIVQGFREGSEDCYRSAGYRVATIARLWVAIERSRHINHWGTMHARLDRLQGGDQFLQDQDNASVLLYLGDAFSFFASRHIFRRLTLLWTGRIVYQRHWAIFLEDMRTEWSRTAILGLSMWLAINFLMDPSRVTLPALLASSISAMTTILSIALYYRHSKERLSTSGDVSAYIVRVESVRHGLRPLSIIYGLPRALTVQAAILLQYGLFLQCSPFQVAITTLSAACFGLLFIVLGGLNVF